MATLTIRNLPDDVRDRLRVLAAENGRSMEAEVRSILSESICRRQTAEGSDISEATARRVQDMFRDLNAVEPLASDERIAELQTEFAPERDLDGLAVGEVAAERRAQDRRPVGGRPTQAEKLAEARALLRRHVPAGTPLVDEFLSGRRAMWGEE